MMRTTVLALVSLCAIVCSAQEIKDLWEMREANSLPEFSQQQQEMIQQGSYQFQQSSQNSPPVWQLGPENYDPSRQCEVEESARVGCGEPGISEDYCKALNCCYDTRRFIRAYDGPMCYYGKAVNVQCTKDGQFVVVVSREVTLPPVSLENINLLEATDEPCTAVDRNADFAVFQFPVKSCGTRAKVEGDYIVYENKMESTYEVGIGPSGAITRDCAFELTFQCRYLATAVGQLRVDVYTVPPPLPVFQQGTLGVELRLANGVCTTKGCPEVEIYSSYYKESDYPVTKALKDPIYVEVRILERSDPDIALVLNHCWATTSPNPSSTPQWDLLVNGCPYEDDRYLTTLLSVGPASGLQYPTHYKRFIIDMFTFVETTSFLPLLEQIFIHCSTSICHTSATETCQPSCGRTKRDVSPPNDIEKVLVSSGKVLLIADEPVSAKSQADSDQEDTPGFSYSLVGVAALAVLSICGLFIAFFRRRLKSCPPLQITGLL